MMKCINHKHDLYDTSDMRCVIRQKESKIYIDIIENIMNDETEYIISYTNDRCLITNKCKIFFLTPRIINYQLTEPLMGLHFWGYYVDLNIEVTYPILRLIISNLRSCGNTEFSILHHWSNNKLTSY